MQPSSVGIPYYTTRVLAVFGTRGRSLARYRRQSPFDSASRCGIPRAADSLDLYQKLIVQLTEPQWTTHSKSRVYDLTTDCHWLILVKVGFKRRLFGWGSPRSRSVTRRGLVVSVYLLPGKKILTTRSKGGYKGLDIVKHGSLLKEFCKDVLWARSGRKEEGPGIFFSLYHIETDYYEHTRSLLKLEQTHYLF